MNGSSLDLMSYCSWAKKNSGIESLLESHFVDLLSIIESILCLESLLEMLYFSPSWFERKYGQA